MVQACDYDPSIVVTSTNLDSISSQRVVLVDHVDNDIETSDVKLLQKNGAKRQYAIKSCRALLFDLASNLSRYKIAMSMFCLICNSSLFKSILYRHWCNRLWKSTYTQFFNSFGLTFYGLYLFVSSLFIWLVYCRYFFCAYKIQGSHSKIGQRRIGHHFILILNLELWPTLSWLNLSCI